MKEFNAKGKEEKFFSVADVERFLAEICDEVSFFGNPEIVTRIRDVCTDNGFDIEN